MPFRGVIKAKEQRDVLVNTSEITYTIGDRKIRREGVRTAPLGRLADLGQGSVGVICDLPADRVVLYRSDQAKKRFVRMSVQEFRKLVAERPARASGMPDEVRSLLAAKPLVWRHVGTFFANAPLSGAQVANLPEARTVEGLPCDLFSAQKGDLIIEVCHCQRIRVERQLLELVELDLPAEVTGFPLLMRQLQVAPAAVVDQRVSTRRELVQKGARWAAQVVRKAARQEFELLQVTEQALSDSSFTLDKGFQECRTLEEFQREFSAPEGHHDWD